VKTQRGDLLDSLTFMSSVSGGSLTAAHYVLYGRDGLARFREEVLLRDFESGMNLSLASPANLVRLANGGLNGRSNFAQVLDDEVFRHATFADLYARGRPEVWINATDLYHRSSFPFVPGLFNALCSDIGPYPVADAVAASMAVPVVFKPTVLRSFPKDCPSAEAPFVEPTLANNASPRLLRSIAEAVRSYRSIDGPGYVKLVDGGVTDNFGLSSILISRAIASNGYSPMTPRDAIRVRRLLFVVVDAGRGPSGLWNRDIEGPGGFDAAVAATDAAIDAAARLAADSFQLVLVNWREAIVRYRCGLSKAELDALGGVPANWRCDDVEFTQELLNFHSVEPEMEARLRAIETRLRMPPQEADLAIDAGRQAVARSRTIQAFAATMRGAATAR
jgi:NTE family protein